MGYPSSYDLMVFEPGAAPNDHAEFLAWFAEQMVCGEGHNYENATEASEPLRAWLREMVRVFPSGATQLFEDEPKDLDEESYSGYSIGREMIYVSFVLAKAEQARQTAADLAAKYGLGLFEPSSKRAKMWRPEAGKLVLAGETKFQEIPEEPGFWGRVFRRSGGSQLAKPGLPEWMT